MVETLQVPLAFRLADLGRELLESLFLPTAEQALQGGSEEPGSFGTNVRFYQNHGQSSNRPPFVSQSGHHGLPPGSPPRSCI